MRILTAVALLTVTVLFAQSFPVEFKTRDGEVSSRLTSWLERHSSEYDEYKDFGSDLGQIFAGAFSRVYKGMDDSRRVAALQTCLPLLKRFLMSDAIMKVHDAQVAKQYGAVNHGVAIPAAALAAMKPVAPVKTPAYTEPPEMARVKQMAEAVQKNPALMMDPKWMAEYQKLSTSISANVQTQMAAVQKVQAQKEWTTSGVPAASIRFDALRYTKDLSELKNEVLEAKAKAKGVEAQCYEDAMILASVNADMFRLRSAKCYFEGRGKPVNEAALDNDRKVQAQILYNQKGVKGILKNALNEFIQTAGQVDFNAPTASKGMNTVFTNPVHEKQGPLWKAIYRNGKAPTDAAVAFAKAWLAEL